LLKSSRYHGLDPAQLRLISSKLTSAVTGPSGNISQLPPGFVNLRKRMSGADWLGYSCLFCRSKFSGTMRRNIRRINAMLVRQSYLPSWPAKPRIYLMRVGKPLQPHFQTALVDADLAKIPQCCYSRHRLESFSEIDIDSMHFSFSNIGGYSTRTSARVIASAHFKNAIDIFFPATIRVVPVRRRRINRRRFLDSLRW
jgi:hypothetical protein